MKYECKHNDRSQKVQKLIKKKIFNTSVVVIVVVRYDVMGSVLYISVESVK